MALKRRLNGAHVGKVLRSAGSKLSGDQIVPGNKECLEAALRVNHAFYPAFPGGFKIHAWKIGENVEASRIAPETKEAARFGKLLRADVLERCAELGQRIIRRLRIWRGLLL